MSVAEPRALPRDIHPRRPQGYNKDRIYPEVEELFHACTFLKGVRYLLREVFLPSGGKTVQVAPHCNPVFLMNESSSLRSPGISTCRIPKDFTFIQDSVGYPLPSQSSFQKGNPGSQFTFG